MANIGTQAIAELVLRIKAENLAGAALGSLAGNIRALPLVAAGAAAGVALATTKMASDYQRTLTQVANNTTMGTSGMQAMDAAIKGIAAHSPASLDSLAQGYMHISNFGFGAADATKILDAAQKSAVSTGGDVAQTADILANVLHEYGMGGNEAAHAMDVLHLAAAQGNMTLQQLVESGGRAIGMAANLHIPLTQVTAALSALTRHGESADVAGTYVTGMLSKIVNPTKAARDELTALSEKTGIDLLADFTPAGLQTKGLAGVLADLRAAHVDAAELFKIVPAQRGGLAAQILTGTGAADYTTILASLGDTMAGKTTPTADAYARSQATLAFQTGLLKNNLQELGITIGTALLPPLTKLVAAVVPIVQGITAWASAHATLIATATPIFIVLSTIAGLALLAGPAVALLAAAFSPLSLTVMGLVGAIGLLSVAWATNWSGIQQKVAAAWAYIQPALVQIEQATRAIGSAFTRGGLAAAAGELMTQAGTLLGRLLSWIGGTAWPAISGAVGRWAVALWSWVGQAMPQLLAALGIILGRTLAWIGTTAAPATGRALVAWGSAFAAWALPAGQRLLAQWPAILGRFLDWIAGAAVHIVSALIAWTIAFTSWFNPLIPRILGGLALLVGAVAVFIAETALTLTGRLARWGAAFVGWVAPRIGPLLASLGQLLGQMLAWIGSTALPAISTRLARWAVAFWQWVGPATANLISHLGPLLDRLGGWIGTTALPAISAKLVQWGTAFWHWIVVAAPQMEQKLGWFLGEMIVWIPTATVALALKLVEWGAAFIGWIVPRAAEMLANLLIFLGKIQTWIVTTAIPALLKLGWDMGTQLIAGLIKGISEGAGQVKKAIENALHGRATPTAGGGASGFGLGPPAHPAAHPRGPAADASALLWPFAPLPAGAGAPSAGPSAAATASAAKDFSAALGAFGAQKGLDPADQRRMQADIALVARTNTQQAAHLKALLDTAVKHNHEAIAHAGAVLEMQRRHQDHQHAPPAAGGGGAGAGGTTGGGLSPATQAAIAAAAGNAPKKETPAQTAAADFRAALTYFRAEKGLDPALVARMQADIAIIARSDPSRAKDLAATLQTVRAHREDAIRHAGAVAAHHAQVLAQRARVTDVHDDVNRFKTDLITLGTGIKDHARLVADYLRIQKDEIAAHYRGSQVALDLAENMKKVGEHFKIAAAARLPAAPVPRYGALAGETGYGQTVVSFGGAQVNPLQAMVAALREQISHLRAQLTKDDQVIALLELNNSGQGQQLGVLRSIAGGIARIPVPPGPSGTRSAHSVLKAAGSYAPVTR